MKVESRLMGGIPVRIAVTGGSGLIGRALIRLLRSQGHEILILSRLPHDSTDPMLHTAVWSGGGAEDRGEGWRRDLRRCDGIVHLAGASIGQGRWTKAVRDEIMQSRRLGTRRLVDALREGGPRVLVSASAVGYYGDGGDRELREDAPTGHDFAAEVCRVWEEEASRAADGGARVARARLGVVFAPQGGALSRMLVPFRLFLGGPIGSGRQWVSWIHIEDTAAGLAFLLQDPGAEGAFNVTAPEPVRSIDLARAIGRVLGRPSALPVPAAAMRLMFGEMADVILLAGQRALPDRLVSQGFQFRHPDVEGALLSILKH